MPAIRVSEAESPREQIEEYVIPNLLGIVLRFSQLSFLAPVRLRRAYGHWAMVKICPGLVLFQRLLVFLCNVVAILTLIHLYLGMTENTIILTGIAICCLVIFPMSAYTVAVLYSPGKLQRIITLLRQLQKINNSFKCTNVTENRHETWLLSVYITWPLIGTIILTIIDNLQNVEINLLSNAIGSVIWYQSFVTDLQLLQWSLIIHELKSTLSKLNDELQSWLESSYINNISHIRLNMKVKGVNMKTSSCEGLTNVHPRASIPHISDCYEEISDLLQNVEEDNSTFLLLMIILMFLRSLLTPYNFLVALDSKNLKDMMREIAWSFFHIFQLLTIVEPSHRLHQQQHRTRRIVCKLAGELGRWDMNVAQLEPLLLQVQMKDAALAPMGLFRIARPLVASMIGTVATALIMIVQFRKM